MKFIKQAMRLTRLALLIILALAGGFVMLAPRRSEQDYDNEVKTELVEGLEDQLEQREKD